MHFECDEEPRSENYVTREQFAARYPHGAAAVLCRLCGRMLLAGPDDEPDCGMHEN